MIAAIVWNFTGRLGADERGLLLVLPFGALIIWVEPTVLMGIDGSLTAD
jgi:hypothetical protein